LCRPQEIDEAARRRLVKRLYIPLPDAAARKQIVENLMQQQLNNLSDDDINNISQQTDGEIFTVLQINPHFSSIDELNNC